MNQKESSLNGYCSFRNDKKCQWFEAFNKSRKNHKEADCTKPESPEENCGVPMMMTLFGIKIKDEIRLHRTNLKS